jgi:hypothetical protein
VAGTDPVAIDAYVAKAYWNLDAEKMPYLALAAARGLETVGFCRDQREGKPAGVKVSQLG